MIQHIINFEKVEWTTPIQGVKHKLISQSDKKLRLVEYSKEMPPHWCEKGHYGLILEGEFEIEFENEKLIYKKGDGIFIPDGEQHKHKSRVLSATVKVIFVEDI